MKLSLSFIAIIGLLVGAPSLRAQVVVIDPTAIARAQANHTVDLAKYVQMVNNQVTQINTLTQQLQQIQAYVKAFVDPVQLVNIVGANQLIGSLQQSGVGETIAALQQSANGIQALRYSGNGLFTTSTLKSHVTGEIRVDLRVAYETHSVRLAAEVPKEVLHLFMTWHSACERENAISRGKIARRGLSSVGRAPQWH